MTNPTDKSENDWSKKWEVKADKAEIFARQIVSYITEGNTGETFEADVDDVAEMLREFAANAEGTNPMSDTDVESQRHLAWWEQQPWWMPPELERIWERWKTLVGEAGEDGRSRAQRGANQAKRGRQGMDY